MIDLCSSGGQVAWSMGLPEILVILFVLGLPVTIVVVVLVIVNRNNNKGE